MEIDPIQIQLTCLFCDAVLGGKPGDDKPKSGDLITCPACGQGNDFDSVMEVAKEKGVAQMKDAVKSQLADEFKKLFKK